MLTRNTQAYSGLGCRPLQNCMLRQRPTATTAEIEGSVRFAVAHLFDEQPELTEAYLARQMRKWVNQPARGTLIRSVDSDPVGYGWQRVTRAGACDFCKMLADRGGVYTRKSVYFASHGSCNCGVVPSWDPSLPEVDVKCYEESKRMAALRRRAANGATDDDIRNARRAAGRAWSGPVTDADRRKYSDKAREILSDHNARAQQWMNLPDPDSSGSGGKKPPKKPPALSGDSEFDKWRENPRREPVQHKDSDRMWAKHAYESTVPGKSRFQEGFTQQDMDDAIEIARAGTADRWASGDADLMIIRHKGEYVWVKERYYPDGTAKIWNAYPIDPTSKLFQDYVSRVGWPHATD